MDNKFNSKIDYIKSITTPCDKKIKNTSCCDNQSYKNKNSFQPFNSICETKFTNNEKNKLFKNVIDKDKKTICNKQNTIPYNSYVRRTKEDVLNNLKNLKTKSKISL